MKKTWLDHEKEKRADQRHELDASVEVHKENFGGSQQGRIHDISASGTRITTELSINENEDIVIHLQNPKTKQHVTLVGEVCWLEDTSESRVQAGIQFHPLDGHSVTKLKQLIREVSGNPLWENKQNQHFSDAPSLEQEISKILDESTANAAFEEINDAPEQPSTKPAQSVTTQHTTEDQEVRPTSRVRFFTFVLFFLFAGIAGGSWWLEQQNQEQMTLHKAKEAISVIIRDSGLLEQDIEPGKPVPPEPTIPLQTQMQNNDPSTQPSSSDDEQRHLLNSAQGIQSITWSGEAEKLTLTIRFDQLLPGTNYQIQKLDFDPNNMRYLIKLPIAQSKLEQNDFILNHPLVQQIRIGIHALETGSSLHLVLDMVKAKGEIVSDRISNNQLILELVSFE